MSPISRRHSYVPALWEYPNLCLAFFGIQFLTPEGRTMYEESGIENELVTATQDVDGLLLTRPLITPEGNVLMQYWRSYAELDAFARRLPHGRWWKWLLQHGDQGVGFYHEIYQVRMAEAVFEANTTPVGPALFCSVEPVTGGEGRSRERQSRFAVAAESGDDVAVKDPQD